ncbi:MAG TPA: helix-turn-helix domain-containing protein [bacterium]|jgi:predicted DNA-binding transcriptional regulator AlpA|nr:helix-turn-helix domain-containing protein [bacterium]
MADDDLLSYSDIAALLGVSAATIRAYRHTGRLPEPDAMLADRPRWRRASILAWQAARPGQAWRAGQRSAGEP